MDNESLYDLLSEACGFLSEYEDVLADECGVTRLAEVKSLLDRIEEALTKLAPLDPNDYDEGILGL
jgi:hypothetical protein